MKFIKPKQNVSSAAYSKEEYAIDVGINILALRTRNGWTQSKLAKQLGTYQSNVARAENGSKLPSHAFLLRIAKVFKTGLIAPTFECLLPSTSPIQFVDRESSGWGSLHSPETLSFNYNLRSSTNYV